MGFPDGSEPVNTPANYLGDGSSGIYIWGAHLYRSDLGGMVDNPDQPASLASYVPTISAAVYLPRRGHHVYNGSAWANEGLLHESEARTNLALYSSSFDNPAWTLGGSGTRTANYATAPDGTTTADRLQLPATSGTFIYQNISYVSGTSYTFSVWVKATSTNSSFDLFEQSSGTGIFLGTQTATSEWQRFIYSFTASGTGSNPIGINNGDDSYASDILIWGAQLEAGSTPSSYIPTAGATVTRAAETLTIPSAKLPWPTPQIIGDELVTNGTFDTDSDWTKGTGWTISSGVASSDGTQTAISNLYQDASITNGNVYAITYTLSSVTAGNFRAFVGSGASGGLKNSNGTYTDYIVASGVTARVYLQADANFVGSVDNVSVREINPLSVSIQMEGRMTYADNNATEATLLKWDAGSGNNIFNYLMTFGASTGFVRFAQSQGGTGDQVDNESAGPAQYSPGIFVPFNIASRHGSTFVNGAIDGVALTANTTPTALPDLSATDLELGYDMMGTIARFRVWDVDLGDTGIEAATAPSLEPSLSLTFDSTEGSFTVDDWRA